MPLLHRSIAGLAAQVGDEQARAAHLCAHEAVEEIATTTANLGIDCQLTANGLTTVSTNEAQDAAIDADLEAAVRLGIEAHFLSLSPEQARARIRSDRIRRGVHEPNALLINPARLARGLAKAIVALGGELYEQTAVLGWEKCTRGFRITTSGGSLQAERVVLAGNAYGVAWPPLKDTVVPLYSYIGLTRPLSDSEWRSVGWDGREGAEDKRATVHYFRPTPDGRILWGGREPGYYPNAPNERHNKSTYHLTRLRESFEWFFPQIAHVPFEGHWGGPIAVTPDSLPSAGWADAAKRIAYAHGYNGHGVAICNLTGHALADLLSGATSRWTELCFVGKPPTNLGPQSIRRWLIPGNLRAMAKADDSGRPPELPLMLRLAGALLRRR
jgi:glycine/D-amino acid oxidase-like deaminating enzyme